MKAKKGIKVLDDAQKPKRASTVNRRKIKRNSSSFKKLIISKEQIVTSAREQKPGSPI